MKKLFLNGNWKLNYKNETLNAIVPGSFYNDMLKNKKIKDPYWRDNEITALELMKDKCEYYFNFDVDEDILENPFLVCEGLDTLSKIFLNDKFVGESDNMHRVWRYSLKDFLKKGKNYLKIVFDSPTKFIKHEQEKCFCDGSTDAMQGFPHIRKAHCMFGWDWGARLPDMGIWRDIYIENIKYAKINSVYIEQDHNNNEVLLNFIPEIEIYKNEKYDFEIIITSPFGEIINTTELNINIKNPFLWNPNGYGEQFLYEVQFNLILSGNKIDSWKRKIGLRTLNINREKDQWGESFEFIVNGYSIFAMGANYIPEDHIFPRRNYNRTKELLENCIMANMNCIRIWGGGIYNEDYFYDLCDELGLIVWQDFMFACAMYELSDKFYKNIEQEFIDNIKRLRHHPSIALWCGNNELEWFVGNKTYKYDSKQFIDYVKIFEVLIPQTLKKYDPNRFYWPASPSSGGGFDDPNDANRGDTHYWAVWHEGKPFSAYREYFFRFTSEFGFQSFPSIKTIKTFTEPKDRNIFSYVMEKHQRNNSANGNILKYLGDTFLYPNNFELLIYASQLLQAEAIKYGVEHWRRNRERCKGAIYWQLNDCWPVASWSSIDYYGRLKALHYYAKRFFSKIMVSAEEVGIITQNTNVNAENFPQNKSVKLCVSNEMINNINGTLVWSLRDNYSNILEEGSWEAFVPALTSKWFETLDFINADFYKNYVSFSFIIDNKIVSEGTVIFSQPKHFNFINPELKIEVNKDNLIITSKSYAKSVEIDSETDDLILSDNYFDMDKGVKIIKIVKGEPKNIFVRSVYDIR